MTLRLFAAVVAAAAALPAADPQLLNLVMPDAKVLAGADVQQTFASPWGQYLLAQMQANDAGLQKLMESTGFDPRRDLREVLVASTAAPGSQTGLLAARGSFDVQRILGMVQLMGQQTENYQGVDIVNGNPQSLAFLDSSTMIAGDAASVRAAIDRRASATSLSPAAAVKVNQLSTTKDAWALSLVPLSQFAAPGQLPQGPLNLQALEKIEEASGGIKFGTMVELSAEAVARTDADAAALADVIRFLAGLVQMNSQNGSGAEFAAMLNNLNVSAQANVVTISLAVPEDQFERLARPTHHGQRGAAARAPGANRRAR